MNSYRNCLPTLNLSRRHIRGRFRAFVCQKCKAVRNGDPTRASAHEKNCDGSLDGSQRQFCEAELEACKRILEKGMKLQDMIEIVNANCGYSSCMCRTSKMPINVGHDTNIDAGSKSDQTEYALSDVEDDDNFFELTFDEPRSEHSLEITKQQENNQREHSEASSAISSSSFNSLRQKRQKRPRLSEETINPKSMLSNAEDEFDIDSILNEQTEAYRDQCSPFAFTSTDGVDKRVDLQTEVNVPAIWPADFKPYESQPEPLPSHQENSLHLDSSGTMDGSFYGEYNSAFIVDNASLANWLADSTV